MTLSKNPIGRLMAFVLLCCGCPAFGQTLAINNDNQTYATLAATTVTMTGRSELHITGATTPITGSIINLNSADSWFFMNNIRPSVVSSTYLSQIRVNGAAAAVNINCRIVQFADGTVVIPHSSTFTPLQVFSGSHFTGTSMSLANYTAYNDSSLGTLANKISSFKLKRGYTATLAQNANGTGTSINYVAQDGDIEVSLMPDALDDSVSFIRVFPWRWTGKKGIAGDIASGLNVRWDYNWNINRSSILDVEYVPIRQLRYWPDLAQNWNTLGSNHLLGYNEPDQAAQANLLTGDAIWSWPDLLGTGLRLGAPAVSDGGVSWLYDFMNQADSAGLRVDFVPVHYYRSYSNAADPDGATTQFYNFLKAIHDVVQRPLWVTEFNNGANWTTGPDPTAAQQQATVAKMMEMLDNTPWVERYSLYNWVEDVRRVKWDDGSLTAAGVTYRDKVSPLAYSQVIPEVMTTPDALYRFENDTRDNSANGHPAMLKGSAKFTTGKTGQAVVMSGNVADGDCVQLSNRIGDSTDFTFGAWVYPTSATQWQRVFDLGSGTNSYMFLSPISGSGNLRFAIKNSGAEQQLNYSAPLPLNTWTHVAVTISGNTGKLFVNGSLVDTNTGMTINPVDLVTSNNFLGKSQFAADPLFAGRLDDVEFLSYALADSKIAAMMTNTPPQFTSATIIGSAGTQGTAYNGNLAGTATDADAGDTITYTKASGPAWLVVAANGTLSGTPTFNDEGNEEFIIYATDSAGASTYALLTIQLPSVTGTGTWGTDNNGNWSDTAKWIGAFPANGLGSTANFSTINITADRTATLDSARTISTLLFGDTSGSQSWTLGSNSGKVLTLQTLSGTPTITVNQNTATLTTSLAGTNGFTKTGVGTLILKGDNSLSGTVNTDSGSTSVNEGIFRLAHPNAAAAVTAFVIRNNNTGSSVLELDGTLGPISSPATVTLSGRNVTANAISNLSGNNTLSGTLTLQSGGGNYYFQADAGTLTLGALTSLATGSRTLTFFGAGNFALNGVISNGSATTGIGIVKNGTGTLLLGETNSFTSDLTINSGTVSAGTAQGSTPATSNLGALQPAANRNITINSGATLSLTGGNVLGTGASSNTLTNNTLIINSGGLFLNGLNGSAAGWWNKLGAINLNGGTIRVGSGANTTNFQGLALIGNVTVGGNTPSTIENYAASNSTSNGIHLGQNATAGQVITFNVADATASTATDLTVSAKLLNTSANLIASGLLKTGAGTMALTGANSYSGATTVSTGKLVVNGSITASPITVSAGATLGGSGSIASANVAGKIAPGNSAGTLTASGSVTVTGLWETEIDGTFADRLNITGTLTLTGSTLDFNVLSGGTTQAAYIIASYGSLTGTPTTVLDLPFGYALNYNYNSLKQIALVRTTTGFAVWANNYGFSGNNALATTDPDFDGITNSIEYLLGMVPNVTNTAGLPTGQLTGGNMVFTFIRNKAAALEFSSTVETTPSLTDNDWTPVPAENISVQDNGQTEIVTATIPLAGAPKLFVRLKVQ